MIKSLACMLGLAAIAVSGTAFAANDTMTDAQRLDIGACRAMPLSAAMGDRTCQVLMAKYPDMMTSGAPGMMGTGSMNTGTMNNGTMNNGSTGSTTNGGTMNNGGSMSGTSSN